MAVPGKQTLTVKLEGRGLCPLGFLDGKEPTTNTGWYKRAKELHIRIDFL